MNKKLWTAVGIGAGVGALTLGAVTFASAENTTPSPSSTSQSQQFDGKRGGMNETPLTGADAEKATAAALAAVPGGTVIRVETDSDGTYEAHVSKTDGTEVEVKMDKDFNVTSVEDFVGRGGRGPGMNETPLTGADAEKATAAAKAKFPDGTVLRVETDADGTYEAHVRKADGTEVEVKMDKDFNVTSVEEFTGRGPGMNETPLTGEKADKVKAAVKAEYPNATILRVETDDDGTYEAHITKADGTELEVKLNKNFKITGTEEHGPMGGRGPQGITPSASNNA
jgi:uncharacterized membrane protein YkoI